VTSLLRRLRRARRARAARRRRVVIGAPARIVVLPVEYVSGLDIRALAPGS
jgi:hypothetical protein